MTELSRTAASVLGVFPSIDSNVVGGVEVSARLAWECFSGRSDSRVLCYSPAHHSPTPASGSVQTRTKIGAAWAALTNSWPQDIILFWHMNLLRLLPFLPQRARVVLFLHGIEAWRDPGTGLRALLRRVNLFLSNSEHTWNRFTEYNPTLRHAQNRHVALGIDAPLTHLAPTPDRVPTTLMIGRMASGEDYKGHREMIAAWPLVNARIPEAELWIAGDGDLRPTLERVAAAGPAASRIKFLGRVPEWQKPELIARCRCLAMPSQGEGFGLVYLEAMRVGRPCLVSVSDAGREVVNPPEAGLAVDPLRPELLAAALSRLLTSGTEWDGWSHRSRLRYESNYTAVHFQQRLLAAIEYVS